MAIINNKDYIVTDMELGYLRKKYFGIHIDKNRLRRNREEIANLIEKSGANSKTNNTDKVMTFAKYLSTTGTYYADKDESTEENTLSRHPFSLTETKTGCCEAYVITFSEGMRQLGIKNMQLDIIEDNHTACASDPEGNGNWKVYDVTPTGFDLNDVKDFMINNERYNNRITSKDIQRAEHIYNMK